MPGFAPCELDLEHPDLGVGGDRPELLVRQAAVGVAHAVLGGADLEDDVAAAFEMEGRQPAFAGIHPAAGLRRAARQARTAGPEIAPKLMPKC